MTVSTAVAVTFRPVAPATVVNADAVTDVVATVIVNWSALPVVRSSSVAIFWSEIVAVTTPSVAVPYAFAWVTVALEPLIVML